MTLKPDEPPRLSKQQAAILSFLFERIELGSAVGTLDFALKGDFAGHFVAAHAAVPGSRILVFTLPTYSTSVFFGVCRSEPIIAATTLANLEDYERERVPLRTGEVIKLPDAVAAYPQTHSVLLLRTATMPEIKQVPDRATIGGQEIHFALALPLSPEEYELRQTQGHDALMDKFVRDDKSLLLY